MLRKGLRNYFCVFILRISSNVTDEIEIGVELERGGLKRGETGRFLYVHPEINKGGIQRKHISFFGVGSEGHNEQTISFSIKWCVFWLSHLPYCRKQSKKTVLYHQNDFLRKILTDD